MEFIRKTIKLGNSSGVILPRKLLGAEVKISVINIPLDIKKEALKALDSHLDDLLGIYIIAKKPLEVLAVSSSLKKLIYNERIKILLVPLEQLKKDIKSNPELKKKISQSETILNHSLLSQLKKL